MDLWEKFSVHSRKVAAAASTNSEAATVQYSGSVSYINHNLHPGYENVKVCRQSRGGLVRFGARSCGVSERGLVWGLPLSSSFLNVEGSSPARPFADLDDNLSIMSTTVIHPSTVEILNQEIDREGNTPSYYRMLVDKQHFKYITIDPNIYDADDLCFPPMLLEKLPPFPDGDWNYGHISQTPDSPTPSFVETYRKSFPSITSLWHEKSYDYLSLKIGERLRANVYMAASPQFEKPVIAKFARFGWEIGYYAAETRVYSWIDGHDIGPKFLRHLTEEGRVIDFLLEYVEGYHASISDLPSCKAVVERLHGLGILHKDLNKHNFLISEKGAVLIDLETAVRSNDTAALEAEIKGLEGQLLDQSGIGGVIMDGELEEQWCEGLRSSDSRG